MFEKSGSIVLTEEDLKEYNKGLISERVKQSWDFSLADLTKIIEEGRYITIKGV